MSDSAIRKDPIWWANHYRKSVEWYVIRVKQLLDGEDKQTIENILRATLPAFANSVGVDLDEVKIS